MLQKQNLTPQQLYIIKKIGQKSQSIRSRLINDGYSKQNIQQYFLSLITRPSSQCQSDKSPKEAVKRLLRDNGEYTQFLYKILEKYDVLEAKMKMKEKQKKQLTFIKQKIGRKKQKKMQIDKKDRSLKDRTNKAQQNNIDQNNDQKVPLALSVIRNFQNTICQNLLKAEMLKDFINKKMMLALLCQGKLDRLSELEEESYENQNYT